MELLCALQPKTTCFAGNGMSKKPLNTLLPTPPIYCQLPNFGIYLMLPPTSNYHHHPQILSGLPTLPLTRHHLQFETREYKRKKTSVTNKKRLKADLNIFDGALFYSI